MKKKRVREYGTVITKVKDYTTIGVRFVYGVALDKIYTYKVLLVHVPKLYLGKEIVAHHADTGRKRVACVVRVDDVPRDTDPDLKYVFITEHVTPL